MKSLETLIRELFRDDPSSAEALESRSLISAKIDEAGKSLDFDTIYRFASFLIGEMRGEGMPQDLAKRLATHLGSAAEFYKESSKMKRAFIRLNPCSKGSLALLNGEYEIAVVVTSDAVIPYRTKVNYDSGFYMQKYHIVRQGAKLPGQREDFSDMFMDTPKK